ncbi:hypothetical protein [Clostridium sp. HBUAS56010]|uniref:hypothetical protein n=1 Tax=Clostridium sp. HBUAS56010 TaxID=2571127 RepID=UPI0011782058|nr:hypothetical protein [Clostridium sp. HBUAS56010]
MAKTGLESADTTKLHVRYGKADDVVAIAGKPYMRPKEWAAQADPTGTLTFIASTDLFMRGEYPETPINDADYTKGFQDYLNKTYDDVYLISTVGGPYKLIPHFEIGGR